MSPRQLIKTVLPSRGGFGHAGLPGEVLPQRACKYRRRRRKCVPQFLNGANAHACPLGLLCTLLPKFKRQCDAGSGNVMRGRQLSHAGLTSPACGRRWRPLLQICLAAPAMVHVLTLHRRMLCLASSRIHHKVGCANCVDLTRTPMICRLCKLSIIIVYARRMLFVGQPQAQTPYQSHRPDIATSPTV